MSKLDFKREMKHLYRPSASAFTVVEVPPLQFLLVDGHGDPNTAQEYQEALGARDRATLAIASARMAQADAELKLVAEQLERIRIKAPFSGTLVSGDLSRAMGAPLERGQLLFEIVPNDGYRVSLQVDEHDMAGLEPGQRGRLRLAGLPDTSIPLEITRVVPVASTEQGGNHFRVEGELQEVPDGLRPGMQGVAKVVTGRGSLLWSWTRELTDRLRLWLWSVGF
jgi:multidrug efflux pump subunit AcrA (membrane-fusion protein)